ncbi:MAG: amidohydrolase family protein [Acidimicrobiales bacterium]
MVTDDVTIHVADTVCPIAARPFANGGVAVRAGTIIAVGDSETLRRNFPDAEERRWTGVLTPGLVNAHTHLQYTSFASVGCTRHETYTAWSIAFVEEYEQRRNDDWLASANAGVDQMLANGITCIADIVTDYVARDVLVDRGVPGIAYLELIGTDADSWRQTEAARLRRAITEAPTTQATSIGISPHAPYSLDEPVLEGMAALARALGVRLHVHVAESDGEDEYYRSGTGSLADRLRVVSSRPLGILERGGAGMTAAELVEHLGLTGPDCHIAHGVYLGREGRAIMARTGTVVALCPRSNLVVGIDPPPVADFLREGVPFAVGTDSLGSTPSLDLLEDVALLRSLAVEHGYDADDLDHRLLAAATMGGAGALGLDEQLGSLVPGKRADLAVFDVDPSVDLVERSLVEHGAGSCVATIVGGEIVSESGRTGSGS